MEAVEEGYRQKMERIGKDSTRKRRRVVEHMEEDGEDKARVRVGVGSNRMRKEEMEDWKLREISMSRIESAIKGPKFLLLNNSRTKATSLSPNKSDMLRHKINNTITTNPTTKHLSHLAPSTLPPLSIPLSNISRNNLSPRSLITAASILPQVNT